MLMLALLAAFTHFTRQSNLNASLLAGNIFGYFLLSQRADTALSGEVIKSFTELGAILLLFFAGLSVDLPERYCKRILPMCFWYVILSTAIFSGIAYGTELCEGSAAVIFFGLACALASKNLCYEYLHIMGQSGRCTALASSAAPGSRTLLLSWPSP